MPGVRRIQDAARQRRRTLAVAAAAIGLLLAGLVVAVAASGGEDEPESVGASVEVSTVPSVVGLRTARAEALLADAGLASAVEEKASRRAAGTVLAAKPKAGSRVERGAAILLIVSNGKRPTRGSTQTTTTTEPPPATTAPPPPTEPPPTVTDRPGDTVIVEPEPAVGEVPYATNVGFVDSIARVQDRGYVAETYPIASTLTRGLVVRQQPPGGARLARGRTVRLYVAVGRGDRGAVDLDDFSGLGERQARELLARAGLTVRTVERPAPARRLVGRVLRQQPAAGVRLPVLSQVVIFVGR